MQLFYKIGVTMLLCSTVFFGKQYVAVQHHSHKFVTTRQKKKLFQSVGCQYGNAMKIEFANFDKINPTKTNYYKAYHSIVDALSKKYREDVINHKLAPMYLAWVSPTVGYGVYALQDIAQEEFIGLYAGQLRLMRNMQETPLEDVDYAWYYTFHAPGGKKLIIDGKYYGNELRFINHDNNPNTTRIDVLVNGIFYVCYVANKFIPKDTQLTVSYGQGYWTTRNINPAVVV